MARQVRPVLRGTSEQEAREAEQRVTPDAAGVTRPNSETGRELDGVRLHRDAGAAGLTEAVGARAVTMGDHVYLSPHAPAPDSLGGRRLLAHELTHVLQQRSSGAKLQHFSAGERPQIAKDLAAMMAVVEAIVNASSRGDQVLMDELVRNSGGRAAGAALPGKLNSEPPIRTMMTLRYLMTRRCGLLDMRHFMQLLYVSWFGNFGGDSEMANRAATKKGIEHEETSEKASKYGPEDLTSNALGAWTATRLAGFPQRGDTIARIRETLERCAPIDFDALSPASQTTLVNFYAAQTGAGEPANQNRTAVALIPAIPELAGQDRSFPFELNENDPKKATIGGTAFDSGAAGLTGDTEIRSYVDTQREEVLRDIPAAVRGRLGGRLLQGWVSDEDLGAFERLYRLADAAGKTALRGAAAGVTLSGGQKIRLKLIVESP